MTDVIDLRAKWRIHNDCIKLTQHDLVTAQKIGMNCHPPRSDEAISQRLVFLDTYNGCLRLRLRNRPKDIPSSRFGIANPLARLDSAIAAIRAASAGGVGNSSVSF